MEAVPDHRGCLMFGWDGCFAKPESLVEVFSDSGHLVSTMKQDIYNRKATMDPRHEAGKNYLDHAARMGNATKAMQSFLQSRRWVHFLEQVSGIQELRADPEMAGAGIHATAQGGHLDIHTDFNHGSQGHRRVNMFVFLNHDWREEYGGHLELWDRTLTRCQQRFLPIFGRVVIFSTTDFSYHGHPRSLTAPEGRVRRSLAQYYYTKAPPPLSACMNGSCDGVNGTHGTLFYDPKCECAQSVAAGQCS